jgi:hypothetical protein
MGIDGESTSPHNNYRQKKHILHFQGKQGWLDILKPLTNIFKLVSSIKVEKDYYSLLDIIVSEFAQLLPRIRKARVPSILDLPPLCIIYYHFYLRRRLVSTYIQYHTKYKH